MSCQCQQENNGLGFLPVLAGAEAGSVAGPIGTVVGAIAGVVASIFGASSLFGDDQATDYRPPADSATRFVPFNDSYGNEQIAYDATSPQSLQIGINNGNRVEDIYSYYSAFVNNSVNAGASSAAAKVITDVASKYNVSISRAADLVLKVVGIVRQVKALITSPPTPTAPTYRPPTPIPSQPIYQPVPIVPQVYTQPTPQLTQPAAAGATDNSNALLLGGGAFLLLLLLARRRD